MSSLKAKIEDPLPNTFDELVLEPEEEFAFSFPLGAGSLLPERLVKGLKNVAEDRT